MDKIKIFKIINIIPLVLELIIHFTGSIWSGFIEKGYTIELIRGAIITVIAMLFGEGYAAIMFFISGIGQDKGLYVTTIIMCFISSIASIVGYMFVEIEGRGVLPMTISFLVINIIIFVLSIVEMSMLKKKRQ